MREIKQEPKKEKRKKSGIVYNILIAVCFLVIVYSGGRILLTLKDYHDSEQVYQNARGAVTVADSSKGQAKEWYQQVMVDFPELLKQNDTVKAWIYMENNDHVNYPVLYKENDDNYWLRKSMDGKYAIAGSIFLEGKNRPNFEDYHSLVYGHQMNNKTMFGSLSDYKDDPNYYQDHQYFQIIRGDVVYRYQVFAWSDQNEDSDVYAVFKDKGEDYANHLKLLEKDAMTKTDVQISADDKVVTLSTCSKTSDRFIVSGKRVAAYVYASGQLLDEAQANAYESQNP